MKKVLVAMAVLAATSAFAQSSVTLYGRLDLGLVNSKTVNNTGAVGAVDVTSKKSSIAGNENGRTTSRLGVRGTEDLGGGLIAGFNIETKVFADNSAAGTFGQTRLGNLFLSGGFGTVVIGTYLNGLDDVRGYGQATYSNAGGDFLARHADGSVLKDGLVAAGLSAASATAAVGPFGPGLGGRSENSLGYRSPSFGGFVVRANLVNEKSQPGSKIAGYGLAAGYDNGPLSALVSFGTAKASSVSGAGVSAAVAKINDLGLAVSYNLGIAVPYFQLEQTKLTQGAGPAAIKVRAFEVGSKFPLGAFTPYVTLSSGKHTFESGGAGLPVGSTAKSSGFQVGTTYDISKRTYLYGAVGTDKVTGGGGLTFTSKRSGVTAGLVHSF
jgi:predicted porin